MTRLRLKPAASASLRGCLWLMLLILGRTIGRAADTDLSASPLTIDLATPAVMTGTFYEIGSNQKKVLFQYRRSAVRDGALIQVEQLFLSPDGATACREHIQYRNGQLVSYATEDLRAEARGVITIDADPKKPRKERVLLEQVQGRDSGAKTIRGVENYQTNMLICDTIYPFILAHWDEILHGTAVKFRLISLDPPTTFGFKVVKQSETTWRGRPVLVVKMEPANLILSHLVHPIFFSIELAAPHRVFSYTGRITPRDKVGGAWKFVEAEAVFDWK